MFPMLLTGWNAGTLYQAHPCWYADLPRASGPGEFRGPQALLAMGQRRTKWAEAKARKVFQ